MDPDLMSAIGSLASVAVAVIAAVVAYFAWKTAQNSAEATAALTDIEKARWHAENRPEFQLECDGRAWLDGGADALRSKGPSGQVSRLDERQLARLEQILDAGAANHVATVSERPAPGADPARGVSTAGGSPRARSAR